jgi:hypothetical protein
MLVAWRSVSGVPAECYGGVNLPMDVARREVNRTHNEKMQARKERNLVRGAACRVVKERREDTPTEFESPYQEEEEGEVIPPPLSPLRLTLPICSTG